MSMDLIAVGPNRGTLSQGDARAACEADGRFDIVVFCAEEFQPQREIMSKASDKVRFLYAPLDDGELSEKELMTAMETADLTARAFKAGKRILITCMQGRNRSGLVTALTLHILYGMGGGAAAEMVRRRRRAPTGPAMNNPSFNRFLENIPTKNSRPELILSSR